MVNYIGGGPNLNFIGPEQSEGTDTYLRDQDRRAVGASPEQTDEELIQGAVARADEELNKLTEDAISQRISSDRFLEIFSREQEKRINLTNRPNFFLEEVTALNTDVSPAEARFSANTAVMRDIVRTEILPEVEDTSIFGIVGDFLDYNIARGLITDIEDLGIFDGFRPRVKRLGSEILEARFQLEPEEFKTWFSNKISEVKAEGVFTSDNLFAFMRVLESIEEQGIGPAGEVDQALAGVFLGAGAVGSAARVTKMARSWSASRKLTQTQGPEAGSEVAVRMSDEGDVDAAIDGGPSSLDPRPRDTKPSQGVYSRIVTENEVLRRVIRQEQSGAGGRLFDPDLLQAKAAEISAKVTERFDYRILNTGFEYDPSGTPFLVSEFGKSRGGLYKTSAGAERTAERFRESGFLNAEVVEDTAGGYKVRLEENVQWEDFQNPLDLSTDIYAKGVVRTVFNHLAATALPSSLRDLKRSSILAQQGEAQTNQLRKVFDDSLIRVNKLRGNEMSTLNDILTRIRDGEDSVRRTWYNDEEFGDLWEQATGTRPADKVLEAYRAVVDVSDANAVLLARRTLNRYIRSGYQAIKDGDNFRIAKVREEPIPQNEAVYDLQRDGIAYSLRDVERLDLQVWELETPLGNRRFFTNPSQSRRVQTSDVFAYNPGGPRLNPNVEQFIFGRVDGKPARAILGARVAREKDAALRELSAIRDALKENAPDIDEVIRANNAFNPDIEDLADFQDFLARQGIDDFENMTFTAKERDVNIQQDEDGFLSLWADSSADEYVRANMARNDQSLVMYGGGKVDNADPVSAIRNQASSTSFFLGNRAYTREAVVGWTKLAIEKGLIDPVLVRTYGNNYEAIFKRAEITSNTPEALRMRELRNIGMRRLNMQQDDYFSWKRISLGILEATYGSNNKLVRDITGALGKGARNLENPQSTLLRLGFNAAFFASPDQALMQMLHIPVMVANMGTSTARRAFTLTHILRTGGQVSTEAEKALLAKRISKTSLGISESQALEMIEYMQTVGRQFIDSDILADGSGHANRVTGYVGRNPIYSNALYEAGKLKKKVGKYGLMPFHVGELYPRLLGISGAMVEWVQKGNGSLATQQARDFITWREQSLSGFMTNASRSQMQTSLGGIPTKIPFQFYSYSLNVTSQVFFDKDLTKAQRARMFLAISPFWGFQGMLINQFFPQAADQISEATGMEYDGLMYRSMKGGVLEGMLNEIMEVYDEDTAGVSIAGRAAAFDAFYDFYRKLADGQVGEAIAGPSGGIAQGLAVNLVDSLSHFRNGRYNLGTQEIAEIARNFKFIDNLAQAHGIWQYGVYTSRRGMALPGEFSPDDALTVFTGFTPLTVEEVYNYNTARIRSEQSFNNARRQMDDAAEIAFQMIERQEPGSVQTGIDRLNEISGWISISPFTESQKAQLRRSVLSRAERMDVRIYRWLMEQQNLPAIERLQNKGFN